MLERVRTTPLWRAFAADRALLAAFGVLSLSALSPLFVTPILPLTDVGFNGLAGLLPHVLLGDGFLNEWYKMNWRPVPYWSAYVLQGAFTLLFGATLAVKVMTAAVVLLMPLALMRLALALGRDPRIALLGFLLVWDKNLFWGWLSFQLGMGLCVWTLARLVECNTWRQALRLWPLTALIGLTHIHAIALLAVAGGLIALSGRPLLPPLLRRGVALSATLLPVLSWLATVPSSRRGSPLELIGEPLRDRITGLYRFTLDNYRTAFDRGLSLSALGALVATIALLSVVRRRPRVTSGNHLLATLALCCAALGLYFFLPFEIAGPVSHWWTYPRFATYALLGAMLLPRPDLSRRRGLLLLPALGLALALHVVTARQFRAFGESVRPFLEIEQALPEHQRLYPVSYGTDLKAVQGFVVISLHGYLAMEKKAYDPHLFDTRDTPVRYRKRLPQHDWSEPSTFRFEEHAKDYDYVLLYRAKRNVLRAALRKKQVELVKEAGPWQLYRVIRG